MGQEGLIDNPLVPEPGLFAHDYQALVVGASGAIGQGFVAAFQKDARCLHVETLSRAAGGGFDLEDPAGFAAQASALAALAPFDVIIDATGALVVEGVGPEKSLNALDSGALLRAMQINAIGPALLLRHLAPLLAPGASIYAKLSARVGSITDNRKGGWYGYRASKAALNMLLHTAAIELQRKNPQLRVVALQPGTVRSKLSQPFSAGVAALLEPDDSAAGMLRALKTLQAKPGAHFVDYQGGEIPW